MPVTRRDFLSLAALGTAGAALRCRSPRGPVADDRPNILLIMADEHAWDVAGCYGDPLVRTPNLDRLAEGGVLFESCYTPSPLCAPARLAFLAGRHVNQVRVWANTSWLPSDDIPSLPSLLTGAGYGPWLAGKMHLDATRRYGYRELYEGNWNQRFKTGLVDRIDPGDPLNENLLWLRRTRKFFRQVSAVDENMWMSEDRRVTEECARFLAERGRDDGPFFLTAGYFAPHYPLQAPAAIVDHYSGRVPDPDVPDDHLETLPVNYVVRARRLQRAGVGLDAVRRARAHYWARIDWLDRELGRLLRALAGSAHARDTIVVYTADHGEMKGDHGLWRKGVMFDSAARVPLIVHWPERWAGGQRRDGVCSLHDLGRTIADVAGADVPDDWTGRSLLPSLDDARAPQHDEAFAEFYGRGTGSGFAMLRRGRYKYVYHCRIDERHGSERELYDLEDDPGELHSIAAAPDHVDLVAGLHGDMVRGLGRDPEDSERMAREEGAAGYGRLKPEGANDSDEDGL